MSDLNGHVRSQSDFKIFYPELDHMLLLNRKKNHIWGVQLTVIHLKASQSQGQLDFDGLHLECLNFISHREAELDHMLQLSINRKLYIYLRLYLHRHRFSYIGT